MITLLVLQGPDKGRRFELPDAPAMVGRDSRVVPLNDTTASRRHAEIRPAETDASKYLLKDLGSANGTYVNGTRVRNQTTLKLGDQIRIGKSLLVFGAQPGVSRTARSALTLAGEEAGMDSAILNTLPSSDDSLVLAVPEPAAAAMANLKMLYRLAAALGSAFAIEQVAEVVMDLVFEHVRADRGIILLIDEDGEIQPTVVRTRDEDLSSPEATPENALAASRTIINHVIKTGQGVLSSNAMNDKRFMKGASVQAFGIRSALCVPMKAAKLEQRLDSYRNPSDSQQPSPGDLLGLIYIDSSVKNYTYSVDQLRLLTAIGLQAGLAIQNAKLYQAGLMAERLAAVGETTAALSHSIKNILQALRGGADVVEIGFRTGNLPQARKGWHVVDRNLEKIYNLTMNLLAYSRPRTPDLQMVYPGSLINECLELIAPLANDKGVMAVADVDKDQPPVPMDPDAVHQVLMNLLTNALDAVPRGTGLIKVHCHYDSVNKTTVLEVQDNGHGIPPTVQPYLFDLFHSTKGNRGTGLGLAVTRKIVHEHEGTIEVSSKPGEGATFTIHLPAHVDVLGDPHSTHGPALRARES